MTKYTIGADFGTLSGRVVLLNLETGELIAQAVKKYTHEVMDETLPDGTKLGPDWALQYPTDYLEVLYEGVPAVLSQSGVAKDDVIGMSIDFTACTMLPTDKDFVPLCLRPEFEHQPHAYIKLWKHHAAQKQANQLNATARQLGEDFLVRYGGKISSEWFFPKIMQIQQEAPDIYSKAACFCEATDWVNFRLCGEFRRNSCTAGYKAIWHKRKGYPADSFFAALGIPDVRKKLPGSIIPIGRRQGTLTPEMAEKLGLTTKVAVAAANVDAHVSLPAVGVTDAGKMLMIMGTSTCDIMLGKSEKMVPGMCGVVEDGVIEGYFGYEAGQSCVGDHFDWFATNNVPPAYFEEAGRQKKDIQEYLTEKAGSLKPGESGLLALDWWNGNRSVLVDVDLTGMMLGMTLATKPEEVYRALIEATAYGKRMIIDTFTENGVPIEELYACGGISWKNPLMMQIYADVTNRPIHISANAQTPALGAAMFGAVAAGKAAGGFDTIEAAAKKIGKTNRLYRPIPENVAIYQRLYAEYKTLHDYFGRGDNDVMKRLKTLKAEVK